MIHSSFFFFFLKNNVDFCETEWIIIALTLKMHEQVLMNWILQHPLENIKDEGNNDNVYLSILF